MMEVYLGKVDMHLTISLNVFKNETIDEEETNNSIRAQETNNNFKPNN